MCSKLMKPLYLANHPKSPCTPINVGSSNTLLSISSANTTTYTCYSYEWTAPAPGNVTLTFEFRNDYGSWYLDDVSVMNGSNEMLINGNFESGNLSSWVVTFHNGPCQGNTPGGQICSSRQYTGNYDFCDGCNSVADEISQSFIVTAGQVYVISFWLATGSTEREISALVTIRNNTPPCTPNNVGSSSTLLSISSANTTTYSCYCYEWTASVTGNVTLTFEFRNDPSNWYLDDVSVTSGRNEMLVNGNFESGNLSSWVVTSRNGVCAGINSGARICKSRQYTGNYDFCDGCNSVADEISQSFIVTVGQVYVISFWLATGSTQREISALVTIRNNTPPCTPINVGSSNTLSSISSANTTTYSCYCYEWTAPVTGNVTLTFEFRNDYGSWYLDDVSVMNGSNEMLINGNFESGNLSSWVVTFHNGPCQGNTPGGQICSSRQYTGNYDFCDGCNSVADEISQSFIVTVGQVYVISFWLATGSTEREISALVTIRNNTPPCTPNNVGSSSTLLSISSANTTTYSCYCYEWTASVTGNVTLTFEFRNDPSNWYLDDVSVTSGRNEMLVNGNFESGNLSSWVVTSRNGVCAGINSGARICKSRQYTGNYDFCDGCNSVADEISQSFIVTVGQVYVISFWLATGSTQREISALVTIRNNTPPCTPINVGSSNTLSSISSANTTTYSCYCYEWTAPVTGNVTLTFEFRNDYGSWYLDDVSVMNGSNEMLINGNFESGNLSSWVVTFHNGPCQGNTPGGQICSSRQYTGNYDFCDGCNSVADEISQSFIVTVGQVYVISFWLATGSTEREISALVTIRNNTPPCTPINVGSSSTLLSISSANTTTYSCYCYEWTASVTGNVTLTFEFRNDPSNWYLDDVSVTSGSNEMLVDGNFESGNLSSWVVTSRNGVCAGINSGARICKSRQYTGNYDFCDGCNSVADEISQSFIVTVGQVYVISFWLATGSTQREISALVTIRNNTPPCTPINVGSSSTLSSISSANTTTYSCYCYEWTAPVTGNVTLTFEFRNDYGSWYLDDVSVMNGSNEMLINGNFESGNLSSWVVTFHNGPCQGNTPGGQICSSRQYTGNYDFCDGCNSVADEISQSFIVTVGQVYVISFWLATGSTEREISALVTIRNNTPPCTPINVGSSSTLLSISSANTTTYSCYCYEWTASVTGNVTLTFEFRNDPSNWYLDDVSVTSGSNEMLVDGNFESGNLSSWVVTSRNGVCAGINSGARICKSRQYTGNYDFCDGCNSVADEISQSFIVTVGQVYVISFWLATGSTQREISALVTIRNNTPPCTPINVGSSSTLSSISSANTTTYSCYCYEWTAPVTGNVTLTFEFRNDYGSWYLDDVSVMNGSNEMLINGNFESGNLSSWVVTFHNGPCQGNTPGGQICSSRQYTGNYDFCDGCNSVADEISQSFIVTVGQVYVISFWLATGSTEREISALVTIRNNTPPCTPINVGSSSTLLSISSANTTTYSCYCYEWTASVTGNVTLTFEFRNDPSNWYLDDVSVTSGSNEMLVNGNFESGNLSSWVVTSRNGVCAGINSGARICKSRQYTGNYDFCDGCNSVADEISQSFIVTVGQVYVISFWLATGSTEREISALVTIRNNTPPCTPINVGSSSTLLSIRSANTTTYSCYCYEWTAPVTGNVTGNGTLTFEFRNDYGNWYLDDVSVMNGSNEMLVNGNFESGNLSSWVVTFLNGACQGNTPGGQICTSRKYTGNFGFCDNCNSRADEISQSFIVTVGQVYVISFWLATGSTEREISALVTIS